MHQNVLDDNVRLLITNALIFHVANFDRRLDDKLDCDDARAAPDAHRRDAALPRSYFADLAEDATVDAHLHGGSAHGTTWPSRVAAVQRHGAERCRERLGKHDAKVVTGTARARRRKVRERVRVNRCQ